MFTPHPFQKVAIEHALNFFAAAAPGDKVLYAAPTGSGKSVVELAVQAALPDAWIVTPREEIAQGMLEKLGRPNDDMLDHRICTPVRLRNFMLKGQYRPSYLIIDEAHHGTAETWRQIDLLAGLCPSAAYTATPYRGSPRSTKELLEVWGAPVWLISYQEAEAMGYIRMPTFRTLPLVDDDVVEVRAGEFDITSLESATLDRLADLAEQSKQWKKGHGWDRPTVYAMPSSETCRRLVGELADRGMPAATVSAGTPRAERQAIFQLVKDSVVALCHINIVSEGVDLPLRRLVDAAPTLSPVKWVQHLGRVTRPTDERPEYIATNRNLQRHAYVLEGIVPTSAVAQSEKVFPATQRAHTRALGLEAIGRFKPTPVSLLSGCTAHVYSLSVVVNNAVVQYTALVHPTKDTVWASKINTKNEAGETTWGCWRRCEAPTDVTGFASVAPAPLSPKQEAWWRRSAGRFGLAPEQPVDRKKFQALPVLADLGERL